MDRRHKVKLAEIEAAEKETARSEQELMEREAELLKRAKILERDPAARRLGGRST